LRIRGNGSFCFARQCFVNAVADRLLVIENHTITEFEGNLDDYRQKMNETSKKVKDETEKIIIRMKMAEIAAKLSVPGRTKRHLKKNTGVLRLCWGICKQTACQL